MTIEEAIARLLGSYGEPRDGSPEVLLAEYRRVMTGYAPEVIAIGCDAIIDNETFWPRPAVLRKHLTAAATRVALERERRDRKAVDDQTFTGERDPRVGELLAELAKTMRRAVSTKAHEDSPPQPKDTSREAFRAMQMASRNRIHRSDKRS